MAGNVLYSPQTYILDGDLDEKLAKELIQNCDAASDISSDDGK